jgi:hypothetical protein
MMSLGKEWAAAKGGPTRLFLTESGLRPVFPCCNTSALTNLSRQLLSFGYARTLLQT